MDSSHTVTDYLYNHVFEVRAYYSSTEYYSLLRGTALSRDWKYVFIDIYLLLKSKEEVLRVEIWMNNTPVWGFVMFFESSLINDDMPVVLDGREEGTYYRVDRRSFLYAFGGSITRDIRRYSLAIPKGVEAEQFLRECIISAVSRTVPMTKESASSGSIKSGQKYP